MLGLVFLRCVCEYEVLNVSEVMLVLFLCSSGTSDPYCIIKVDNEVVAR